MIGMRFIGATTGTFMIQPYWTIISLWNKPVIEQSFIYPIAYLPAIKHGNEHEWTRSIYISFSHWNLHTRGNSIARWDQIWSYSSCGWLRNPSWMLETLFGQWDVYHLPSGKRSGKIHHFEWEDSRTFDSAMFNSKLLNYQRVDTVDLLINHYIRHG